MEISRPSLGASGPTLGRRQARGARAHILGACPSALAQNIQTGATLTGPKSRPSHWDTLERAALTSGERIKHKRLRDQADRVAGRELCANLTDGHCSNSAPI